MSSVSYEAKRGQLETYFDRTAVEAWSRLTSDDAEVSRIRATVRAGRNRMRETLLSWLPDDLAGYRVLDAGCGTGASAVELARRGADVVAVDISPRLIELARERTPSDARGSVEFRVGDMVDDRLGRFDAVLAMDSLIHYRPDDIVGAIEALCERADRAVLFTFAPRTVLLTLMHATGRLFPNSNRAPMIEPVRRRRLCDMLAASQALADWRIGRDARVNCGFYISHALELRR
jgi:magnesium-protoporphyrin O-methyltransferase